MLISGPAPFISVSFTDFNLTLILVSPLTFMKSVSTPSDLRLFMIYSPVNPPIKPKALFLIPKLLVL